MTLALGIDLGGTKIEIIALDDDGGVLLRRRRPTPKGENIPGTEGSTGRSLSPRN